MKIKQRTGEWFAREHIDVNHRITRKQTNARRIHEEMDEDEAIVTPTYTQTHNNKLTLLAECVRLSAILIHHQYLRLCFCFQFCERLPRRRTHICSQMSIGLFMKK